MFVLTLAAWPVRTVARRLRTPGWPPCPRGRAADNAAHAVCGPQLRLEFGLGQARLRDRPLELRLRALPRLEQIHLHAAVDVDRAVAVGLDRAEDRLGIAAR